MPRWLDNVAKLLPAQREAEERRQQAKLELADRYVAAAQTKTANHRYSGALASYNRALCLQRETVGEDHIIAGRTLHEIGICLLHLGEEEAALVALKEALYIKLATVGPGDDETLVTKHLIAEVMRDEIQESIEQSKAPPPIDRRRDSAHSGTSAESESSSSNGFGRREPLVNSSKLHNSAKWEYDIGMFGDEGDDQQQLHVTQQSQPGNGSERGVGVSDYVMPLRDDTTSTDEKRTRRMTNPDRPSPSEYETFDSKELRRRSDPVTLADPDSLHEDYHYREFIRQDSGRRNNLSASSSVASFDKDNAQKEQEDAAETAGPPNPTTPRLTKEERLARNREVSAAVDDLEQSIMASLTSFRVGPEGSVQISEQAGEANRRSSLKPVDF